MPLTKNEEINRPPANRSWLLISLFNLLIATTIGALLRFAFVQEISWFEFRNFLHAHSHVAMLGWVYLALFAFFIQSFLSPSQQAGSFYKNLFWATQITIFGMLISFPIVGYASVSIAFSSAHILLSYVFVWRFLKDLKLNYKVSTTSVKFVKTALFFMILSTIAIWTIAPIIILEHKGTGLYHMAIQFYLHFQFNGWFIFGVLALFFKILENRKIGISIRQEALFYKLMVVSCLLTYALAITWTNPENFIFWINSVGVAIQFAAILYFIKIIQSIKSKLAKVFSSWALLLFNISLLSFIVKVFIQTAVLVPYIATVAYTVRNFVIGFLHLMLLGMISCFLFAYGNYTGSFEFKSQLSKIGISLFLIGFGLSELLLFSQGFMLWMAMGFMPNYYEIIFVASTLMPLGIGVFWLKQVSSSRFL